MALLLQNLNNANVRETFGSTRRQGQSKQLPAYFPGNAAQVSIENR